MRRTILVLPLCLILTACDKVSSLVGTAAPTAKPASNNSAGSAPIVAIKDGYKFEINTQSPDQALKTWWRYLDARDALNFSRCQAFIKEHANDFDVGSVATSEVEQSLKSHMLICSQTVYNREINEVKQETETRAIAFVKVTNSTPTTASHTIDDEKRRNKGEQFKYLLEKTPSGWKVSQVYHYSDTNKLLGRDDWEKQYTPYVETFQTYVFVNQ